MIKIFIVEDDEVLIQLYEIIFNNNGYIVIGFAKNGQEALEKYKFLEEKPDIVLMDYRLPVKDGLITSKELIEIDPKVKILMMSTDVAIIYKALLIGACDFIEKPFGINDLIEKINKWV